MAVEWLVSALVTLLVVVDPVGLVPIFLALTEGLVDRARRAVALGACLIALGVLTGFALVGQWLLTQLGISFAAFRIAGGLLLFSIAFEMVYGRRTERQTVNQAAAEQGAELAVHEERARHVAAFPLAIPMLAGPGAITAVLLLAGQTVGRPAMLAALIGVIVVVMAASFVVFLLALPLGRLIGPVGNLVLSRLLGILLAALAVQFVIDGIRTAFAS